MRDAGDQFALAVENAAAVESAAATAPRGVGGVEQPFIRPCRAMEPDRMVEAGPDKLAAHPGKPVGDRRRAEEPTQIFYCILQ